MWRENVARDRGKGVSIGEKIREKYDWCSSFLTISHHPDAITESVDMCVEGEFAVKENFEPPDNFGRFYDTCWEEEGFA